MPDPVYKSIDPFDRLMGALADLPDVTSAGPSTVEAITPMTGEVRTFVLRTFRQAERGDTIFVQYIDAAGGQRFVIPPAAAAAIHRQYDALTSKNRRKGARAAVATRKAAGIEPAFLKKRKKK